MKSNFYPVIMAGGGGTRLGLFPEKIIPNNYYPLAVKAHFKTAIDRLMVPSNIENIKVVTIEDQLHHS